LLWTGRVLSNLGTAVFPVALTMAIVSETGSALDLGLVLAVSSGAEVVFILIGGVWADRLSRRKVMIVADAARCVAQVFIGVQLIGGLLHLPSLLVAAFVTGTSAAFFRPASYGLVPATVAPHLLRQANAWISIGQRTVFLIGPAIATVLTLSVGAGWAVLLDGLTFAVNVVFLLLLRVPEAARAATPFIADLRAGWREVRVRTWFWSNASVHCLWNLARCFFFTVGAAAVITSDAGELGWGIVTQGTAVGALLGAAVSLRVRAGRPLVLCNICLAVGALPLIAIAMDLPVGVVAVAAVMMNAGLGLMGTVWNTTVQQQIPEHAISRVGAFDWLTSTALNPLGMAIAVPLAAAFGTTTSLFAAALLMLAPSLGVLAIRDVRMVTDEASPVVAAVK
jgi:MFS family permease